MIRARAGMMIFSAEFFILVLLLSPTTSEEYCKPGDRRNLSQSFRLLISGVLALKYNVLEQLIIDSSMTCALRCLAKKFCVGFNFKRRAKKKQINCQLTISLDNKFSKDGSEGDSDWNFYKVVGPRKSTCKEENPCKNGGDKIPQVSHPGYKCRCTLRFAGDHCEIEKDSTILWDEPESYKTQLNTWMPAITPATWNACWRTSRDGWKATTFHTNCDNKGSTLTIIKVIKDGKSYIFGGYTGLSWAIQDQYGWKAGGGSFLFSIRNNDNLSPFKSSLKVANAGDAINTLYGPTFGGGHDLKIMSNANAHNTCYSKFGVSYQLPSGYVKDQPNTQALLAGSLNFTPFEIEVFYFA